MFSIPGIESLPLAVQFAVLFVFIFAVFALIILVLRRLMGGRVAMQSADRERTRTRQPRLGIVDVYDLDRQRQLVLLRRDNVEHLLLIGGPNDVVIETNIVRSSAGRAPAGVDSGDRAESERPPEIPASRPVLETSWSAPNGPLASLGNVEVAPAMPAAGGAGAAGSRPTEGSGQGGLQKTLSQYLRRPGEGAAQRPAAAPPAGAAPGAAEKASRPAPASPGPDSGLSAPALRPAPAPPAPPSAGPDAKLPFGMRAMPRPKPAPTAPAPTAPAAMTPPPSPPPLAPPPPQPPRAAAPPPPLAPPPREPAPARDPQPQPAPDNAPPGDISGDLRPAEPSLVDTALLSDMAKQLETALRRPSPPASPQAGPDPTPAPEPVLPKPPASSPQPPQGNSGIPAWTRPAPAPRPVAPPAALSGAKPPSPMLPRPVTPPARPAAAAPAPLVQPDPVEEEANDFTRPLHQDTAHGADFGGDLSFSGFDRPRTAPLEAQDQDFSYPADREPDPIHHQEEADHPVEPASAAAPPSAPAAPAPMAAAAKPTQVDPFSMEDIEAEFARLLGRPLDKR